jgi:hypothetical protein
MRSNLVVSHYSQQKRSRSAARVHALLYRKYDDLIVSRLLYIFMPQVTTPCNNNSQDVAGIYSTVQYCRELARPSLQGDPPRSWSTHMTRQFCRDNTSVPSISRDMPRWYGQADRYSPHSVKATSTCKSRMSMKSFQ